MCALPIFARVKLPISKPADITNEELTRELAEPAAQLLIHGLRRGLFQHERAQELPEPKLGHPPREAKKFQKLDMQMSPSMSASKISAVKRALGQVWLILQLSADAKPSEVRVLLNDLRVVPLSPAFQKFLVDKKNENGKFRPLNMKLQLEGGGEKMWSRLMMRGEDGKSVDLYLGGGEVLKIGEATVSGGKKTSAVKALWGKEVDDKTEGDDGSSWLTDALTFGVFAAVME